MGEKKFNVRVYSIILDESNKNVLLSNELVQGDCITKFPGGGLDWGEGTIDCLKREAMEEFGQEIEVLEHFYTTDFFQKAFYFEDQQLISIYYKSKFKEKPRFEIFNNSSDSIPCTEGAEKFYWFPVENLNKDVLSLPIDKVVANMIKKKL